MAKLLNIGSINIDHVYAVPHFVQEGETLSSLSMQNHPGGKGLNQSIALARAGCAVAHAGRVGADGAPFVTLMREAGVNVDYVETVEGPSGHSIIQVTPKGQNCILLYPGANQTLDAPFVDKVLSGYGAGDILILQNEVSHISYAMQAAHTKGMRIAFNPSPFDASILELPLETVHWFLLNEIEGQMLTGKIEAKDILNEMALLFPAACIVLTVGKDGVLYKERDAVFAHGIYKVPVVDTTAAGDTFTGFFIGSVAAEQPVEEALRLASVASSLAVSRPGAASSIPTLEEVLHSALEPE